ncbi:MAG: hypothetical protein ACE14L_14325 [Terriglobales bacterium]
MAGRFHHELLDKVFLTTIADVKMFADDMAVQDDPGHRLIFNATSQSEGFRMFVDQALLNLEEAESQDNADEYFETMLILAMLVGYKLRQRIIERAPTAASPEARS